MIIHPEGTTIMGGVLLDRPQEPDHLAQAFAAVFAMPDNAVGINQEYPWPGNRVINLDLFSSRDPDFPAGCRLAHRTPMSWKPNREAAEDWVRLMRHVCQRHGCSARVSHAGLSQRIPTPDGSAYENEQVTITAVGIVERAIFTCSVANASSGSVETL